MQKKTTTVPIFLSILCLSLSGCGYSSQDRVLSGAGVGAATGAVTSALVGGSVGGGLLLGTAAGAIIGGVTDGSQLNLGKPLWQNQAAPAR